MEDVKLIYLFNQYLRSFFSELDPVLREIAMNKPDKALILIEDTLVDRGSQLKRNTIKYYE